MNRTVAESIIYIAITIANLLAAVGFVGYGPVYEVTYGFVTQMAAYISITFMWLYYNSGRDIGLAMVISWAGTAGVQGWWWMYSVLDQPQWMMENMKYLMVPLSFYVVGTVKHAIAFHRELSGTQMRFFIPASAALATALALNIFV